MRHAARPAFLLSSVLTLLALLASAPAARAADAKPDEEGFIRDWLMLAPIPLTDPATDELDKKQLPDEGAVKPKPGDKHKAGDKEVAWTAVKAKDYYVDLNETLKTENSDVAGYLVAYVVADNDMPDLTVLMGSNDQAKVYVNGKEVLKFDQTRTIEKDSDKAEGVKLNKGVNTVVLKVINEQNNWQAALRFKDKEGKPVTNVTIKTAP